MSRLPNIYATINTALAGLGYTVRPQGSYAPGATLPETLVTYQVVDQPNGAHADNRPGSTIHRVQVAMYSKRPALVQGADAAFKGALLPAGFLRVTGRDLPLDHDTGHYGYTCDYRFYEREV